MQRVESRLADGQLRVAEKGEHALKPRRTDGCRRRILREEAVERLRRLLTDRGRGVLAAQTDGVDDGTREGSARRLRPALKSIERRAACGRLVVDDAEEEVLAEGG